WSYDDLEHEVRANLVYRAFTRIDAGDVPDAKTILKIARALGPQVIEQLHRQVVEVAKRAGVTHGRRFRVDTTVVETNVHYPTDGARIGHDGSPIVTTRAHGDGDDRRAVAARAPTPVRAAADCRTGSAPDARPRSGRGCLPGGQGGERV